MITIGDHFTKTYYRDADNDGCGEMVTLSIRLFGDSTIRLFCTIQTGDNDATIHSKAFYADNDGDGAGTSVELCAVSAATAPTDIQ
jgi:hypothetical protein